MYIERGAGCCVIAWDLLLVTRPSSKTDKELDSLTVGYVKYEGTSPSTEVLFMSAFAPE